jgi:predicted aconitase with swiveling domain
VLDDALSFWGGFDSGRGEIIDVHHPQHGQRVAGRVMFIPRSKGSAGTPGGIAETLRNGSGPLAFVLGERDVNISIGVLVANRLYGLDIPVLQLSMAQMESVASGDQVTTR